MLILTEVGFSGSPSMVYLAYGSGVTWNPSDKGTNIVLSGGNLTATSGTAAWQSVRATSSKTGGQWYWENTIASGTIAPGSQMCGGGDGSFSVNNFLGASAISFGRGVGSNNVNGVTANYNVAETWLTGDIIMCALNMANREFWVGKNGVWLNGSNPATGALPIYSGLPATVYAAVSVLENGGFNQAWTTNFGATPFTYSPPS